MSYELSKSELDMISPCPFCGSKDGLFFSQTGGTDNWLICKDCHVAGPNASVEVRRGAIAAWNRRENPT